ncbi:MAG: ABC transporter ATP-binding protein [Thermoanaerobaculia bacterium]|nr:ABC transporter ATP-binding protein [Thermoanaerobaculia bacterium]
MIPNDSSVPPASLEGLTVRYGRKTACANVSLSVAPGSVYALLGRNGAGKSSIVRCLVGQQKPQAGRAVLFGEDAWKSRATAMPRVGVVPEEPEAPPAMTPRQLSDFCARLYGSWDAAGFRERLARSAVSSNTPFTSLSKGEKGIVQLALALAHSPELLVLDDPTLGLDAVARRALYEELVGELADRGATVFLTSHDLAGIESVASRVAILQEGRLVLDEDLEALKSRFRRIRYGNSATETRTAFGTELDEFEAMRVKVRGWGIDAIVSNFDEGAFERFRQVDGVVDAEAGPMSLEEIFVAIAGAEKSAARGDVQ